MTTALVFAGNSFIGRHVRAALGRAGARVVFTERVPSHPEAVRCDLADAGAASALVARVGPDWVIQCAGATRTTDPTQLYSLHVLGTLNVLAAVARHAPRARVALFGSAAEYGPAGPEVLPLREDHPPAPLTTFAASKLAQTQLAGVLARDHGLSVTTLRPFNVIGPGLPDHYFAASLARRLMRLRAEGPPGPFAVANLHATRDFVDVRDVADAVVAVLRDADCRPGTMEVYHVASGVETALLDVAALLGRLAGGFVPVDGGGEASRGGAVRSAGDATKLRRAAGWGPRYGWRQSVEDMWGEMTRGRRRDCRGAG